MSTKGGVRPLAAVMNWPEVGPGAKVSAGSTARPCVPIRCLPGRPYRRDVTSGARGRECSSAPARLV